MLTFITITKDCKSKDVICRLTVDNEEDKQSCVLTFFGEQELTINITKELCRCKVLETSQIHFRPKDSEDKSDWFILEYDNDTANIVNRLSNALMQVSGWISHDVKDPKELDRCIRNTIWNDGGCDYGKRVFPFNNRETNVIPILGDVRISVSVFPEPNDEDDD